MAVSRELLRRKYWEMRFLVGYIACMFFSRLTPSSICSRGMAAFEDEASDDSVFY